MAMTARYANSRISSLPSECEGPYTDEAGYVAYYEVCKWLHDDGWKAHSDLTGRPYVRKGAQWLDYDDTASTAEKMDFIRRNGLGGAMIWTVDLDDFRGVCGDPWPLLRTVNTGLGRSMKPDFSTEVNPSSLAHEPDVHEELETFTCRNDGYFSDPEHCDRFYRCHAGQSYSFDCPPGLYFDETKLVCNYLDLVDCQHANRKTSKPYQQ